MVDLRPTFFYPPFAYSYFLLVATVAVRSNQKMEKKLNRLSDLIPHAEARLTETGIPRVFMSQSKISLDQIFMVQEPTINLIVRGSKTMTIGGQVLCCYSGTYFALPVEIPISGIVNPDAGGQSYLSVSLRLNSKVIADLFFDMPEFQASEGMKREVSIAKATAPFLDAWIRMLNLMDTPQDIPALAPVYEREILYRVLQGPMGWMLQDLVSPESILARINSAIKYISCYFEQPIRIESLAERSAMSVSAFYRHFKRVTSLSPIQYQKKIRLFKARTLLLTTGMNITLIAHKVGYESSAQFTREYHREFGFPPSKDLRA